VSRKEAKPLDHANRLFIVRRCESCLKVDLVVTYDKPSRHFVCLACEGILLIARAAAKRVSEQEKRSTLTKAFNNDKGETS
jgi:ribosomal protein S27E